MELMEKKEKLGYKKTEVGLIPNDWTLKTVGELIEFVGGSQPPRDTFRFNYKDGYIRLLQIRDYKTDKYKTFIPKELAQRFCSKDDVMIGRYGPPIFQILRGLEGAYNVALIKAIPKKGIDKDFMFYFLIQQNLFRFVEKLSQRSSGQTGVDLLELKKYPIPLPPSLHEQRAIAAALSEVDALIQSLGELIDKKRAVKQGAMQELLTGRRRLEGFSGEWAPKKIGEITSCTAGGTPSTLRPEYWNGKIRWMSSGELNKKTVFEVEGRITESGLANSSTNIIPPKCILVGLAGQGKTRGTIAMNMIELCTNQSIAAILPSKCYIPEYLYHNLDSRYEELRSLSSGEGGRGGLNLTIIKNLSVPIPSLKEQRAIAQILSDMDAEIEALEQKQAKYRAIKQGMMQELLTGKTRLV